MRRLIIFLFVSVLFSGCARMATGPIVSKATLDKRLAEIHSLIESGSCETEGQCQYIAYGKKACGGPSGYLVFSSDIDVDRLKKMVKEYTIAEDVYNKENNVVSDCRLPNPPQNIQCQGGNCIEVE